jgi:hypothetical protein
VAAPGRHGRSFLALLCKIKQDLFLTGRICLGQKVPGTVFIAAGKAGKIRQENETSFKGGYKNGGRYERKEPGFHP